LDCRIRNCFFLQQIIFCLFSLRNIHERTLQPDNISLGINEWVGIVQHRDNESVFAFELVFETCHRLSRFNLI